MKKRLVNKKLLRCGYTTGTCAAAATKAATTMLFTKESINSVAITTPNQTDLVIEVINPQFNTKKASCSIRKDSGDDPDITNGILISSEVILIDSPEIIIEGGIGVGKVTKPGLDQDVGKSAINSVPRMMITDALNELAKENNYHGGFHVIISVPEGVELAKKTFNPELGIIGGISILGTTGIVEPMSAKALADSIKLEISMISQENCNKNFREDNSCNNNINNKIINNTQITNNKINNKTNTQITNNKINNKTNNQITDNNIYNNHIDNINPILIFLGNFGKKFAVEELSLSTKPGIMCSNFIDVALDSSIENGFDKILLIGHIGKFVKLGIGMFNTHSHNGDGRIETLLSCALESGAELDVLKEIQNCVNTNAVLDILWKNNLLTKTMDILKNRIKHYINKRIPPEIEIGFICFTNNGEYSGILFESENANKLKKIWEMKK